MFLIEIEWDVTFNNLHPKPLYIQVQEFIWFMVYWKPEQDKSFDDLFQISEGRNEISYVV